MWPFSINLAKGAVLALLLIPVIHARESSLIVVDNQTGYILHRNGSSKRKPQMGTMAIVTTAMIALDWICINQISLSVVVTVPYDFTVTSTILKAGDKISLRDLIYCTIFSSDYGAAHALSEYIGLRLRNPKGLPAKGNFVLQMNTLARHLGMRHTLFFAHEEMSENFRQVRPHYSSTAVDIARLIHFFCQKAQFHFYFHQDSRDIQVLRKGSIHFFHLQNTNQFFGHQCSDGNTCYESHSKKELILLLTSRSSAICVVEGGWMVIIPSRLLIILSRRDWKDGYAFSYGWKLYEKWVAKGRPIREGNYL